MPWQKNNWQNNSCFQIIEMQIIDTSYRFTSYLEPTPKQQNDLMTQVIKNAKERPKIAKFKIAVLQKFQISQAIIRKKTNKKEQGLNQNLSLLLVSNSSGKTAMTSQILKQQWFEDCIYKKSKLKNATSVIRLDFLKVEK